MRLVPLTQLRSRPSKRNVRKNTFLVTRASSQYTTLKQVTAALESLAKKKPRK